MSADQNHSRARPERLYPTLAHWVLGQTQQEIVDDMALRGETVDDVCEAFDAIHAAASARLTLRRTGERAEAKRAAERALEDRFAAAAADALDAAAAPDFATAIHASLASALAFAEEPACAGMGLEGSGNELRRATLADLFGKRADWDGVVAVPVRGRSMEGDHIKDGDTVIVDLRRTARDGDIVLVHLAGRGQLLKRLRLRGPLEVELESSHPECETIVVEDPADLRIYGVVVSRSGKV